MFTVVHCLNTNLAHGTSLLQFQQQRTGRDEPCDGKTRMPNTDKQALLQHKPMN